MEKVDLKSFNNSWYDPGAGIVKRLLWMIFSAAFVDSAFPSGGLKIFLLRLFGAKIGTGVIVKPYVRVKYPWFLEVGDNSWIGENVWIDNLAPVKIAGDVCLSQGAFLLTGNHNYKQPGFDLIVGTIVLEQGVWIGAKSVVCPGVTCESHAVLSVGSVATSRLSAYGIYQGNPAVKIREREIVRQ